MLTAKELEEATNQKAKEKAGMLNDLSFFSNIFFGLYLWRNYLLGVYGLITQFSKL